MRGSDGGEGAAIPLGGGASAQRGGLAACRAGARTVSHAFNAALCKIFRIALPAHPHPAARARSWMSAEACALLSQGRSASPSRLPPPLPTPRRDTPMPASVGALGSSWFISASPTQRPQRRRAGRACRQEQGSPTRWLSSPLPRRPSAGDTTRWGPRIKPPSSRLCARLAGEQALAQRRASSLIL
jgi:hypothetical protein